MAHRIGLVLDGGGGKGAYQIGVWRALIESGLIKYVTDVAGSSVGGLNAALFVKGDYEEARKAWTEDISEIKVPEIADGVKKLIQKYLGNMDFFDNTEMNCFITTCRTEAKSSHSHDSWEYADDGSIKKCTSGKTEYFNMRYLSEETRKDFVRESSLRGSVLLATSALPVLCKQRKIGQKRYMDGGVVDNSPAKAIEIGSNCDTIIVIHLDQAADKDFEDIKSSGVSVLEIIPSKDIGGFIDGTVNFSTEHAAMLMQRGYSDSIKLFKEVMRNWAKEALQSYETESDKSVYDVIESLSVEDKYRLFNECEFLTRGNYAKLNYITEKGFGKTIWRIITGNDKKSKNKILKNTVELQDKMMNILVCLDDEMLKLKQNMRYLFHRSLELSDILLGEHNDIICLSNILNALIEHEEYNAGFLAERFPEYAKWDSASIHSMIDDLKFGINLRIQELNRIDEEAWKHEEERIEAEAARICSAKSHKILRINSSEAWIIESSNIEKVNDEDDSDIHVGFETVEQYCEEYNCTVVIQPEGWHDPHVPIINPADYYMHLWFINKTAQERAGKRVCMVDYYHKKLYLYGFQVSENGASYNKIICFRIRYGGVHKHIGKYLKRQFGTNLSDVVFYRTFDKSSTSFIAKMDKYNIGKVDPQWEKMLTANGGEQFIMLVDKLVSKVFE